VGTGAPESLSLFLILILTLFLFLFLFLRAKGACPIHASGNTPDAPCSAPATPRMPHPRLDHGSACPIAGLIGRGGPGVPCGWLFGPWGRGMCCGERRREVCRSRVTRGAASVAWRHSHQRTSSGFLTVVPQQQRAIPSITNLVLERVFLPLSPHCRRCIRRQLGTNFLPMWRKKSAISGFSRK
jgi:hypothetical protein